MDEVEVEVELGGKRTLRRLQMWKEREREQSVVELSQMRVSSQDWSLSMFRRQMKLGFLV